MSESIKQRAGAMTGERNSQQLRKLLEAALVDVTALKTAVTALLVDVNNLRVQHNAVRVDLAGISNNTGSANNTYQLTAVAAAAATATSPTLTLTS